VVRRGPAPSAVPPPRHDAGVRRGEDPEEVHQARVATRRIRSALRSFRDVLEPTWARPLRDRLRSLADDLGAVRDREVQRDRMRARGAKLPAPDQRAPGTLGAFLETPWDEPRDALLGAIRPSSSVSLLDERVDAASEP